MNDTTLPATPSMRQRHKASTRERILAAVARLLEGDGLAQLTFAEIALEADVGESTAYRYFPNKEALLEAFWESAPKLIERDQYPTTFVELAQRLEKDFAGFDAREPLIRGMLASPAGRTSRQKSRASLQAVFRTLVRNEVPGISASELERVSAAIQLLYSATTWATFKDYWDMSGAKAGRAATQAILAILEAARRQAKVQK